MENDIDIPEDADKTLFAVDLVQFFFDTYWCQYPSPNFSRLDEVEPYREIVHNGFNETMVKAIRFIHDSLDSFVCEDFLDYEDYCEENAFETLAYRFYQKSELSKGFQPNDFIRYCSYMADLSGYFYAYNIIDMPEVAVELIIGAFPDGKMSTDAWNILNIAAENIAKLSSDMDGELTPRGSSDSDSEPEDSSSSENEGRENTEYNNGNEGFGNFSEASDFVFDESSYSSEQLSPKTSESSFHSCVSAKCSSNRKCVLEIQKLSITSEISNLQFPVDVSLGTDNKLTQGISVIPQTSYNQCPEDSYPNFKSSLEFAPKMQSLSTSEDISSHPILELSSQEIHSLHSATQSKSVCCSTNF